MVYWCKGLLQHFNEDLLGLETRFLWDVYSDIQETKKEAGLGGLPRGTYCQHRINCPEQGLFTVSHTTETKAIHLGGFIVPLPKAEHQSIHFIQKHKGWTTHLQGLNVPGTINMHSAS